MPLPDVEASLYWHPRHVDDPGLAWLRGAVLQTGRDVAEQARARYGALLQKLGAALLAVDPA